MRLRPIHTILLAALVYWTTGAALYLHERIEHAEPDGADEAIVDGSQHDAPPGDHHPGHHHDHDDCPTCQLLATMQAHHAAPPVDVGLDLPFISMAHLTTPQVAGVDAMFTAPIRGPPVSEMHII